jgi:hypothetical protein
VTRTPRDPPGDTAALLRPAAADRLAPWLIGPLAALAVLALVLGAWAARPDEPEEPHAAGPAPGVEANAEDVAGEMVWTVAIPSAPSAAALPPGSAAGSGASDPAALARRLAAIPGVEAAVPVDPERVARLTDGLLGPGNGRPGPAPVLIDLMPAPGAADDGAALAGRVRAALPTALIARPPALPMPETEQAVAGEPPEAAETVPPQPAQRMPATASSTGGAGFGGLAGLAAATAALALAGLAMTVVTRLSISDNARDIGFLRQLGADEQMIAGLYRRSAVRTGRQAGVAGTLLGFGTAAAGLAVARASGTGAGETLVRLLETLSAALWPLAAILAVPIATTLICRAAAGRTCRRALSDGDRWADP